MNKRSKKLSLVAWLSIIFGVVAIFSNSMVLTLEFQNSGGIYISVHYLPISYLLFSIAITIGGFGVLINKPISQKILSTSYGVFVFVLLILIAKYAIITNLDDRDRYFNLINLSILVAPAIFCLFVINSRETKLYFNEFKT